jgi:hypothetical protein
MKKTITFLVALFLISSAYSQSRQNKKMLEFSEKSEKITKAIGWYQNDATGKWEQNKNVIYKEKCPSYWVSHLHQNFKWIQFRTITKDSLKYYVLVYEKHSGAYKYPSIKKNWEKENQTHFLVLTQEDYSLLKETVSKKEAKNISIKSNIADYTTDRFKILGGEHLYNEENLKAKITKAIESPSYSEKCLRINAQNVDGVDVVRFRVPETCMYPEDAMNTSYFEINLEEFKDTVQNFV